MPSILRKFEKQREPLEVFPVKINEGGVLDPTSISLSKGFTRVSIIAFGVIQTLMKEEGDSMTEPEREFFTQPLAVKYCWTCFSFYSRAPRKTLTGTRSLHVHLSLDAFGWKLRAPLSWGFQSAKAWGLYGNLMLLVGS